jgi:Flp pilus assembly pilin Flp
MREHGGRRQLGDIRRGLRRLIFSKQLCSRSPESRRERSCRGMVTADLGTPKRKQEYIKRVKLTVAVSAKRAVAYLLHFIKTLFKFTRKPIIFSVIFENENPVMKTVVTAFLRDQSGAADFNDALTAFLLVVVFPVSMYFMYYTFGGVFGAVFSLLPLLPSRNQRTTAAAR